MADLVGLLGVKEQDLIDIGDDRTAGITTHEGSGAGQDDLMALGTLFIFVIGLLAPAAIILDTKGIALKEGAHLLLCHANSL
jgi:hypothetical protein